MEEFTEDERGTLRSVAEMFSDKDDRDQLRALLSEGATIKQLIQAYKTQRGIVGLLKGVAGLIVVLSAAFAAVKGLNLWK